jgi:hypothetical protein
VVLGVALAVGLMAPAAADAPAHAPGGPCLEPGQEVRLSSLPSYDQVVQRLASIQHASKGAVQVRSAGRSGEGRELASSPDTGWEDVPFGDGVPCGGGPEDAL